MNNYNLDECYVPGTLKSIADGGIVATADTIYDVDKQLYQSEINASIGSMIENMDVDGVKVTSTVSLSDLLGINDQSTVTDDSVAPYISIYNPITNVFSTTNTTNVEFGTRIINENSNAMCRFFYGSSKGLNTSDVYLEIKSGEDSSRLLTQSSNNPSAKAIDYSAKCTGSYYASFDNPVTIEVLNSSYSNSLRTLENEQAVTRTTVTNLVANNLLTSQHKPTQISSAEPVVEKVDYPSKTISAKLIFNAFQYMFIHRSKTKYSETSFGQSLGKTGYVQRRQSSTSPWSITNNISENYYYAVLIPESMSLNSIYTTFLGQDSSVDFELLCTVDLNGATSSYTKKYKVYQSKQPVAFGDGSMTFTFV